MSVELDNIKWAIQRLNSEIGKSPFDESVQDILMDIYTELARIAGVLEVTR